MAKTSSGSSTHSLGDLLVNKASQQDISAYLDGLTPYLRVSEVLALRGKQLGALYDQVKGSARLSLGDIVPDYEKGVVILEGRNSLPTFSRFQKRFARIDSDIVGYNHQPFSWLVSSGFFKTREPNAKELHPDELFFDYTADIERVPAEFPRLQKNDVGLSRFVYMNMKDYCRRVASGVLVGKAYRNDRAENAYFVLARAR